MKEIIVTDGRFYELSDALSEPRRNALVDALNDQQEKRFRRDVALALLQGGRWEAVYGDTSGKAALLWEHVDAILAAEHPAPEA